MVEATSGNTGIGLAMVCAPKGYPLVVTMADSFSIERRKLMRMLGAKVVLTPRAQKGFGMYQKAKELAKRNGWFLAHQFETTPTPTSTRHDGARDHRRLQGPAARLLRHRLRHRRHRGGRRPRAAKERPEAKIVLCEPANAQLVGSGNAQARSADGAPASSHPAFEPHPIQGWTPDFIPLVLQEAIDGKYYDELVPIAGPEGIKWARELAQKEGILTGISGGSTFAVAMKVAEKAPEGSVILGDAARHRRALPHHAAVRAHRRRHGRGGEEDLPSTPGYQMP